LTQDEINDAIVAWQRRKIHPADAVAMLPWVLGMTRPGWNAFARHHAERELEKTAISYDFLNGRGEALFLGRQAKQRNIEPEAVRRRIRRGRRVARLAEQPPD
jgi:hypothetical protein